MLEVEEPLAVVRAHSSAGGYQVEFEAFPGHIHAGEESSLTFWFAEEGEAHAPSAEQVTGLAPTILVGVNGSAGSYTAFEPEAGMYTALHTFTTAATIPVTIPYFGQDQVLHDYTVNVIVHAPH